jgi:hypothetical protein
MDERMTLGQAPCLTEEVNVARASEGRWPRICERSGGTAARRAGWPYVL